jgi:PAS domain S-box-containing protein
MEQKAILNSHPIAGKIVAEVRREAGSLKPWQAYALAIAATSATLWLRLALSSQLKERPTLIVFTLPIMLSAYWGGLRAGLLATALCYLGASFYLLPPFNSFWVASAIDRWDLFFLSLAGVVISALNEALHRARHRADVAIRERAQEDRRRFFALSQDVFCTLGFDGYFKDLNPAWEKTLGYTRAELLATPFIEFIHPDDREATLAEAKKVAGGKALVAFENRYRCKDGSYRWFQWSVTPIIEDRVMYGVARNVTERRREEAASLKAGALQSAIFNSANFSSIATDAKGVIQIFNVGAERMLGFAAAEVMNKITPAQISDPQEIIARAKALSQELETTITPGFEALVFKASRGIEDIYELTYIRKDGSRFPAVVSVTALRDAQNAIIGYLLIGTDNTARQQVEEERKRLDQSLRDQQFYTRSLIESNSDALMTTDPLGIISDVNKQMEALTGCTRDELIGAPFKNYFTDPERAEAGVKLVLREKKVADYELTACARDGKNTVVSYNATTFYNRDRKLQGVFAAARDVTERKRFEWALQETNVKLEGAKSAAEKANLAKSDFLSSMSHELRTPLNAILGFAQLMGSASPLPTTSQKNNIDQILQAGWYLLKLINEILDLAGIESGKLSLSLESVSLSEIMRECQAMMEPQAEQRGISMTFPRFDNPIFVSADRTRLKQIVINLLSNAIKYNKEQGTVVVDYTVIAPERIRFSVKDSGVGLTPEKLAQLFQPFNRLGQEAGGVSGTGIGLVVTKRLAELMEGVIGVESTVGEGSVFWCDLNSAAAPEVAIKTGETENLVPLQTPSVAPRYSLLYVEDNPANMKLIEQLIERRPDIRLVTANNATLGIELARTIQPDVILMDINLPVISGIKALKILQEDPSTAHIPIVALSANAIPRDIAKGLEEGFFRYITKPIKVKEFMDTVNAALEFADKTSVRIA